MIAIDLSRNSPTLAEILELASQDNVVIRTVEGRRFVLAEIDDFAEEIAATRANRELMNLLEKRSKEPGKYSLSQTRERLSGKAGARGRRGHQA
jgi:hypothetical protein